MTKAKQQDHRLPLTKKRPSKKSSLRENYVRYFGAPSYRLRRDFDENFQMREPSIFEDVETRMTTQATFNIPRNAQP